MTDALLRRLDAWLRAHRPAYFARLQPGATDGELDAFAAEFGIELPPAFRALYRWRDGQDPQDSVSLVDNRMFASLADMAETVRTLDEMIGFDYEEGWWRRGWVPFVGNGGGDHLCLDLCADGTGALLPFWHDDGGRGPVSPTLDAWLAELVASMEEGWYEHH